MEEIRGDDGGGVEDAQSRVLELDGCVGREVLEVDAGHDRRDIGAVLERSDGLDQVIAVDDLDAGDVLVERCEEFEAVGGRDGQRPAQAHAGLGRVERAKGVHGGHGQRSVLRGLVTRRQAQVEADEPTRAAEAELQSRGIAEGAFHRGGGEDAAVDAGVSTERGDAVELGGRDAVGEFEELHRMGSIRRARRRAGATALRGAAIGDAVRVVVGRIADEDVEQVGATVLVAVAGAALEDIDRDPGDVADALGLAVAVGINEGRQGEVAGLVREVELERGARFQVERAVDTAEGVVHTGTCRAEDHAKVQRAVAVVPEGAAAAVRFDGHRDGLGRVQLESDPFHGGLERLGVGGDGRRDEGARLAARGELESPFHAALVHDVEGVARAGFGIVPLESEDDPAARSAESVLRPAGPGGEPDDRVIGGNQDQRLAHLVAGESESGERRDARQRGHVGTIGLPPEFAATLDLDVRIGIAGDAEEVTDEGAGTWDGARRREERHPRERDALSLEDAAGEVLVFVRAIGRGADVESVGVVAAVDVDEPIQRDLVDDVFLGEADVVGRVGIHHPDPDGVSIAVLDAVGRDGMAGGHGSGGDDPDGVERFSAADFVGDREGIADPVGTIEFDLLIPGDEFLEAVLDAVVRLDVGPQAGGHLRRATGAAEDHRARLAESRGISHGWIEAGGLVPSAREQLRDGRESVAASRRAVHARVEGVEEVADRRGAAGAAAEVGICFQETRCDLVAKDAFELGDAVGFVAVHEAQRPQGRVRPLAEFDFASPGPRHHPGPRPEIPDHPDVPTGAGERRRWNAHAESGSIGIARDHFRTDQVGRRRRDVGRHHGHEVDADVLVGVLGGEGNDWIRRAQERPGGAGLAEGDLRVREGGFGPNRADRRRTDVHGGDLADAGVSGIVHRTDADDVGPVRQQDRNVEAQRQSCAGEARSESRVVVRRGTVARNHLQARRGDRLIVGDPAGDADRCGAVFGTGTGLRDDHTVQRRVKGDLWCGRVGWYDIGRDRSEFEVVEDDQSARGPVEGDLDLMDVEFAPADFEGNADGRSRIQRDLVLGGEECGLGPPRVRPEHDAQWAAVVLGRRIAHMHAHGALRRVEVQEKRPRGTFAVHALMQRLVSGAHVDTDEFRAADLRIVQERHPRVLRSHNGPDRAVIKGHLRPGGGRVAAEFQVVDGLHGTVRGGDFDAADVLFEHAAKPDRSRDSHLRRKGDLERDDRLGGVLAVEGLDGDAARLAAVVAHREPDNRLGLVEAEDERFGIRTRRLVGEGLPGEEVRGARRGETRFNDGAPRNGNAGGIDPFHDLADAEVVEWDLVINIGCLRPDRDQSKPPQAGPHQPLHGSLHGGTSAAMSHFLQGQPEDLFGCRGCTIGFGCLLVQESKSTDDAVRIAGSAVSGTIDRTSGARLQEGAGGGSRPSAGGACIVGGLAGVDPLLGRGRFRSGGRSVCPCCTPGLGSDPCVGSSRADG